MIEENEDVRPNESKSFSYVQSGQMFVGDDVVIRIEPKHGMSKLDVERELSRDFKNLRIVDNTRPDCIYIQGTPKL